MRQQMLHGATGIVPVGRLERLPKWLICIPLTLQWLWLSLRYRSVSLPSAANPAITAGGLVGEGKLEYFNGMGALARAATAPYCALSTHGPHSAASLQELMRASGLEFPIVAKPDLGLCGYGVRLVADLSQLQAYVAAFPAGEMVVLQRYLAQTGEAGIFYVRDPFTGVGRITGLALRYFARVVGNGQHNISELMAADSRTRRAAACPQHECQLAGERVPAPGEVVRLATIGASRVGGLYRDGAACITAQLNTAIDAIARDMPDFHFGRFDVRFETLDTLRAGLDFSIMEINGAGAEAIEAWDPDTNWLAAFRIIFAKQRLLFAIGNAQRSLGVQPIGLLALVRLNRRQCRLLRRYPPSN